MKFKKILLKNIRSYKDKEIEFPENSFLLAGDIGSGKTSILLALEYALFGLQPGQKGNSLLRNEAESGSVVLELEASEKNVLIERRLKRTQKGVSNEYAAITIDGEKTESSVTEIKSIIVNLLGYPREFVKKNNVLYRYTVYTPQEQMKQIILEDAESRINILRHVFGIDKYKRIKDNLLILLGDLKSMSKMLQGEISTLDQDKNSLTARKSNLKLITQKIEDTESNLTKKREERKVVEEQIEKLNLKIEESKSLEKEVEKAYVHITTKRELLRSITTELSGLNQTVQEAEGSFDEREFTQITQKIEDKKIRVNNLNSKYFEFSGKINSLNSEKSETLTKKDRMFQIDICPTCLQDVSETHKHNILNETERKFSEIQNTLEKLNAESTLISRELEREKNLLKELEERKTTLHVLKTKKEYLEKSKIKIQDLGKQKNSLDNDSLLLTKHIESLKAKILSYQPFENQFRKKEFELRQLSLDERNIEISLAEFRKELELSYREISLLEEEILKKQESERKLSNLNELIDWLSTQFLNLLETVERNVLLKLRHEFSALFRKWFSLLVTGTLDARIDENFTPLIMQGETEMDYSYLSGGERTAVALAYRLALNQTINSLLSQIKTRGIIILDEPTDGFSDTQITKIRDILEELNTKQLIIVSHEPKIEGFVDNVIRVQKEGDTSSVIQES